MRLARFEVIAKPRPAATNCLTAVRLPSSAHRLISLSAIPAAGGQAGVSGKRVGRAADHHQLFLRGDSGFDSGVFGGNFDEADVHFPGDDAFFDDPGVAQDDPRQHARVAALEAFQDRRQPVACDGRDAADIELPGEFVRQFGHACVQLVRQVEDLLGVGQHQFAGACQGDLAVAAIEQADVQVIFQLLDLKRDRGLGHVKVFRRTRE